jgi:hypothetical protein
MTKKRPSLLIQIPTDQIQLVFSFISLRELSSLSLCCKNVYRMIEFSHYLASHDPSSLPKDDKENLRRSLPNLLNADPISSHKFGRSVFSRTDLTVTRLAHCLNKFLHLRTVKLYKLEHMGDKFLAIINASAMKHTLTHLELHNVRIVKDGHCLMVPCDRLSHVEVKGTLFCTYKVLKSFTNSRNLQVLRLSGCRALLDVDVKDIIQRQNKLQELQLKDCSKLMAPEIDCPSLKVLNFERCNMLKDLHMIKCDNLIHVDLSHCPAFGNDDIKEFLKHNEKIEILSLQGCRGFTEIDIQSEYLREINLGMCMRMRKCKIVARSLTSLEVGMCIKLEALYLDLDIILSLDLSMLAMKNLSISAPDALTLNISGCCKLVTMERFHCPKLMELDICGTDLSSKTFEVSKKTRIKSGGEATDWSNPFRR